MILFMEVIRRSYVNGQPVAANLHITGDRLAHCSDEMQQIVESAKSGSNVPVRYDDPSTYILVRAGQIVLLNSTPTFAQLLGSNPEVNVEITWAQKWPKDATIIQCFLGRITVI